jgi:hypothetical protein
MNIKALKMIAIGDNRCWGKGDTIEEALKNAQRPRHYVLYVVHPDTVVDGMGWLQFPMGEDPKRVMTKLEKARKGKAA